MRILIKSLIIQTLALLLTMAPVFAEERPRYQQPELDQMLAPIALYPDALLSQILMASTYPIEVVQAARWSAARPSLKGQKAVQAAENEDWDPSVKSLVAFPEILSMMNQKLDWTERLGDAFLAQQEQVMDTVQFLRRKAEAAGNLHSGDHVSVLRQDGTIIIEPAYPRVVYVPYYNPVIVYGPWWWPGYPPVYWAPWSGYYAGPAYVSGFYWGSGITISTGFFFGNFDWHHRHVRVVHVDHYRSHALVSRHATIVHDSPGAWRHDPGHRRGAPYRYAAQSGPARNFAPPRVNNSRREIPERTTPPVVREQNVRQPGPRRGAGETIQRGDTVSNPVPRVERSEAERARPGRARQEREHSPARGNERPESRSEPPRRQTGAPAARETRPAATPRPPAATQHAGKRGNERSETRSEPPRRQTGAPAARETRPAATPRPPVATQHAGERGNRARQEDRETRRRPAADHPRAQPGPESRRRGGDAPRREFTPSARRPAPG